MLYLKHTNCPYYSASASLITKINLQVPDIFSFEAHKYLKTSLAYCADKSSNITETAG